MKKVYMITTTTCSVCKMLKPMVNKFVGSSNCELIVENADENPSDEVSALLKKYSIKTVPAFFFMYNDKEIASHFGAISVPDLKKYITKLENYVD